MPAEEEDALTAALWEVGTAGTQWLGAEGADVVLLAYFRDRPGLDVDLRRSVSALRVRVDPAEVPDVDWVARVREGFRPSTVGAFRIVPAWAATSPGADGPGLHPLLVEPGLAFGTGSHESTRLCLHILGELSAAGPLGVVADVGTGSGILAVAAARLGAARVVAVEVDAEALPVAARHLQLNAVPVHLVHGDGARALRAQAFDLLLANISAGLLVERAPELAGTVRGGGRVVLSGLLEEDVAAVRAAWEPFLHPLEVRTEETWAALVGRTRR
ncbi:MAG TPA: 50S ribosomal protein L11 methyltransferase [Vicinamibacteria bacterium]|nr:50S ribosomal protein L11 methyltransferase [Vicinamibacteria bacterium]